MMLYHGIYKCIVSSILGNYILHTFLDRKPNSAKIIIIGKFLSKI